MARPIPNSLTLRLIRFLRRVPLVKPLAKWTQKRMIHLALKTIWLERQAARDRVESNGTGEAAPELDTDELNRAAERYFAEFEDRDYLLDKPFSDSRGFAHHLFDMGVLFHWLRLEPGDVVAEIGAGTCWLSQFLNRYGCKTISIDVSATAARSGAGALSQRSEVQLGARARVSRL